MKHFIGAEKDLPLVFQYRVGSILTVPRYCFEKQDTMLFARARNCNELKFILNIRFYSILI